MEERAAPLGTTVYWSSEVAVGGVDAVGWLVCAQAGVSQTGNGFGVAVRGVVDEDGAVGCGADAAAEDVVERVLRGEGRARGSSVCLSHQCPPPCRPALPGVSHDRPCQPRDSHTLA